MSHDDFIARSSGALLSPSPATRSVPSASRSLSAFFATCLAVLGVALYFLCLALEYSPNPWAHNIETWKIPRGGPEAAYVQQLLMAASLVLAAVAASAAELLVGLPRWQWPYQHRRFFQLELSWAGGVLWLLILGSMTYWFLYEEITELKYIYEPSGSSYDVDDYSYEQGSGNDSSYAYGGGGDAPPPPSLSHVTYAELSVAAHSQDHAPPHGHEHGPPHGPPHGFGGGQARWVQALSDAARQAGLVAMIPISLLGVPLARSSALWRLVGLSYEEAVNFHRWLGILAVLLTSFHTLGYVVVWMQPAVEFTLGHTAGGLIGVYNELFSKHGVAGLNPWCDNTPPSEFGGLSYNPACCGVSNLAGLIAWASGILIWVASIERVRRSRYLLFIQALSPISMTNLRCTLLALCRHTYPALTQSHDLVRSADSPTALRLLRLHVRALVVRPLLHGAVRHLLRCRRRAALARHLHVQGRHGACAWPRSRQGANYGHAPVANPCIRSRCHRRRRWWLPIPAAPQGRCTAISSARPDSRRAKLRNRPVGGNHVLLADPRPLASA